MPATCSWSSGPGGLEPASTGAPGEPYDRLVGYVVGVGPGREDALDAARSGGVIEGAVVTAPDVPTASGICHAVESPNTEQAVCGQPVARVLDQSFASFDGLEHCVACDAVLAESGNA